MGVGPEREEGPGVCSPGPSGVCGAADRDDPLSGVVLRCVPAAVRPAAFPTPTRCSRAGACTTRGVPVPWACAAPPHRSGRGQGVRGGAASVVGSRLRLGAGREPRPRSGVRPPPDRFDLFPDVLKDPPHLLGEGLYGGPQRGEVAAQVLGSFLRLAQPASSHSGVQLRLARSSEIRWACWGVHGSGSPSPSRRGTRWACRW